MGKKLVSRRQSPPRPRGPRAKRAPVDAKGRPRLESKVPSKRPARKVSQAEYARLRNVSRVAVHKAVREGRIPVDGRGRIDPDVADQAWAANTQPKTTAGEIAGADPDAYSLVQARTRNEFYKSELARLELGERSGELVTISDVRDVVFRATRSARDLLDSIADRLAEVLAGVTDPEEIRRQLRTETARVKAELDLPQLAEDPPAEASA